jgi:thiosulfate/3-mercaptopyruvate sulfurtransferase
VSGDWLECHLKDPNLRIYDCSTQLVFEEDGDRPYRVVDCLEQHEEGHIPGAGYLRLQADFSEEDSPFGMTLASPERVAEAFEKNGVSDETRVILYSRGSLSWATRFWWMLRWLGFDDAAVLDGGFDKWTADRRETSIEPCGYLERNPFTLYRFDSRMQRNSSLRFVLKRYRLPLRWPDRVSPLCALQPFSDKP